MRLLQADLVKNEAKLFEKIQLLCVMEVRLLLSVLNKEIHVMLTVDLQEALY